MKRFGAFFLSLCLLLPSLAGAQGGDESTTAVDGSAYGITVVRNHVVKTGEKQKLAVDYPTFESDDAALAKFLTDSITTPILAMRKLGQMAEDSAYAEGGLDTIRSGYFASLDFENLLSVEATVTNRAADAKTAETSFFYRIVDLKNSRILTVEELFVESADKVNAAIGEAVYQQAGNQGILLDTITDASAVPVPNSYYLDEGYFRTIFAAGTLSAEAVVVDLPWDGLALTPSELLAPAGSAEPAVIGGADGPTEIFVADGGEEPVPDETEPQVQPSQTPAPQKATQQPGQDSAQPSGTPAIDPDFALPPVVTPTPMPLTGNDAIIADVLIHGLWKQLGTDGETYYQFTADGKLLTVSVSDYTVTEGVLSSDVMNGTVDVGSDSAFTLRGEDGTLEGYVLNRQGEAVAPEEFVTPSPTPVPTPTPTPTAVPTPEPTPEPTPTLSPYELALTQAPSLAALGDASFEKRSTLKVYTAPEEGAYRDSKAQVTTDETVAIYGVENGWVLVSYAIGNGSRGRVGYIENTTLAEPESVAQLNFASMEMTLTKNAEATDDPLNGKATFTKLKKGDTVTLLAFMGSEWAYVQIAHDGKPCRLFIPQAALMEE